jgi:hypothetical protein
MNNDARKNMNGYFTVFSDGEPQHFDSAPTPTSAIWMDYIVQQICFGSGLKKNIK